MYPVRWLHCQYAQHGTVTSSAPYLGYRWLNTGSCQNACIKQDNYLSDLRRTINFEGLMDCEQPIWPI
jgi:hypothetical protein